MTSRVLMIDHRDSFVFILGDQFAKAGAEVLTLRPDVELSEFQRWIERLDPDLVVLSPGPGHPSDCGLTVPWLRSDPKFPILGVCLGHQALAFSADGTVIQASVPVHGHSSDLSLLLTESRGNPLARAFSSAMSEGSRVARYHSLVVAEPGTDYEVMACCSDEPNLIMAIGHRSRPRLGIQFHPESILTPNGSSLCKSLLESAAAYREHSS